MNSKIGVILVVIILLLTSSIVLSSEIELTNPLEKNYYYSLFNEKARIYIDYQVNSEQIDEVFLTVDSAQVAVLKNNLVKKFSNNNKITIKNSEQTFTFDKEIFNQFEYSSILKINQVGNLNILLGKNQISFYPNINDTYSVNCNNQNESINNIKFNEEFQFQIKGVTDGQFYTNLIVTIDKTNLECNMIDNTSSFKDITYKSIGSQIIVKKQLLESGSYYANVPKGVHIIKITGKTNEQVFSDTKMFEVIPNICGDGICTDKENKNNCPADCSFVICTEDSYIGDTNNDGIVNHIDNHNLQLALENNEIPDITCCIDINEDNVIDSKDLIELQIIIRDNLKYKKCDLSCSKDTKNFKCSKNKPYYCNNKVLEAKCDICGCADNEKCLDDGTCFSYNSCKCADISTNPDNPNDYDNYIDTYDKKKIESLLQICKSNQLYNSKYDLNSDGCINENDILCITSQMDKFTTCAGKTTCRDGTQPNECSLSKPEFCEEKYLINKCKICGCPDNMICQNSEECTFPKILESKLDTNLGINENLRIRNNVLKILPSTNAVEFAIELKALQNLSDVELNLDLKHEKSNQQLNNIKYSINEKEVSNFTLNKNKQLVKIKISEIDNNEYGTYSGELKIMVNGNTFETYQVSLNVKDYESTEIIINITDNINHNVKFKTLYQISGIFVLIIIGLIILIVKRRKDKKYLNKLRKETRLI